MSDDKTIIAEPGSIFIQAPQRNAASLIQYNGSNLGKRIPLREARTVVGRTPEAHLFVNEASVSRQHAAISSSAGGYEIEDLGSSNGSFINDVKVTAKAKLKDGDMIRLGTILFRFFASDNAESSMTDKIYRMATIDSGTDIFNKKYLLDALETEMKAARQNKRPMSIIFYDLDFFRNVNTTLGHPGGDVVLRETSSICKKLIRKGDVLGRYGGEEFVIVLPDTDLRVAADLAERLRVALENHVFNIDVEGRQVQHKQTMSLGVSQFTPDMQTVESFIESADKKLYTSKHTGRNKVTS
jgi:two-component system, cell cycle response regulator